MRMKSLLAIVTAILALGLAAPRSADAGHRRPTPPDGWGETRVVHHWVYYPRYLHVHYVQPETDRYAYRYVPRGYYPYTGSPYWRPAHEVHRPHHGYALPPYRPAWGYSTDHHHDDDRHVRRRWR